MEPDRYPDLTRLLEKLHEKSPEITINRQYLAGTQENVYDEEKWREEFGPHVAQPRDNLCPAIVSEKSDLMVVAGFQSLDGDKEAEEIAAEIWRRNRGDVQSSKTNYMAVALGSHYCELATEPDSGRAVMNWPAPETAHVFYDDFDATRELFYGRVWLENKRVYARLAYPNGTAIRFKTPDEDQRWGEALPRTSAAFEVDEDDIDTGFPEVLAAELAHDGSDLTVVRSLQDQVNLQFAEMALIAHAQGWPTTVLSGVHANGSPQKRVELQAISDLLNPPTGPAPTGAGETADSGEYKLETGHRRIITLEHFQAKAQQLAAANLDGPLRMLESTRAEMPYVTGRPAHIFQKGAQPSGESQWEAGKKLRNAAKRARADIGWGYARAMELAVWLERSHNDDGTLKDTIDPNDRPRFVTLWEDEEESPAATLLRVQTLIDLGVPAEDILSEELGITGERLEKIVKELQARREQAQRQLDQGLLDDTGADEDDQQGD